jgi:hypothetical protein
MLIYIYLFFKKDYELAYVLQCALCGVLLIRLS